MIPIPPKIDDDDIHLLAEIAAKYALLPNRKVVTYFRKAVFPSIRDQKRRFEIKELV